MIKGGTRKLVVRNSVHHKRGGIKMSTTNKDQSLYQQTNLSRLQELGDHAPDSFVAFNQFNRHALAKGELSVKFKELIAVAVAHVTGCAYCIDIHVKEVKKAGASREEVSEAIFVATALKAGSAFAHGVNALNAFDDRGGEELYKASYFNRIKEFSTLQGKSFSSFIDFDQQALKAGDRKSTRLNSSHVATSYDVYCSKQ